MSDFSLVIFDYDGTLFDTRAAIVHCISRTFGQCGRAIPERDAIEKTVGTGVTLPDTLLLLDPGLRRDCAALDALVATYRSLYRDEATALLRPYPGVAETLQDLHLGGVICTVVSNKGIDAIRRSLDEASLSPFIDFVIGDQPGIPKKPDPAVITDLIAPKYALGRHEMLIVGDTELDIKLAKRSGIASCWASYGYGAPASCRPLKPDNEIASIGHLQRIVFESGSRRAYQIAL